MTQPSRQHVSSGSPYEPRLGIARAVRIGNSIAVAGTAPLGSDGQTVAPGDATAQARRCFGDHSARIGGFGGKPFRCDSHTDIAHTHRRLGECRSSTW
jgi:enamine deaminase RidA (YjgF/YER057c/UK114 family)